MSGRRRSTGSGQPVEAPAPRLRIVGPPGGRWRAGRRWGPEPVEIDADALGPEAIAALRADPALELREIPSGQPSSLPGG